MQVHDMAGWEINPSNLSANHSIRFGADIINKLRNVNCPLIKCDVDLRYRKVVGPTVPNYLKIAMLFDAEQSVHRLYVKITTGEFTIDQAWDVFNVEDTFKQISEHVQIPNLEIDNQQVTII